jgi:hypothetical protein
MTDTLQSRIARLHDFDQQRVEAFARAEAARRIADDPATARLKELEKVIENMRRAIHYALTVPISAHTFRRLEKAYDDATKPVTKDGDGDSGWLKRQAVQVKEDLKNLPKWAKPREQTLPEFIKECNERTVLGDDL